MHYPEPKMNQKSPKGPKSILILTMKLLYTYFWKMLPIGALIWLTPIWLIEPKSRNPPQITKKWCQVIPFQRQTRCLESDCHVRHQCVQHKLTNDFPEWLGIWFFVSVCHVLKTLGHYVLRTKCLCAEKCSRCGLQDFQSQNFQPNSLLRAENCYPAAQYSEVHQQKRRLSCKQTTTPTKQPLQRSNF